MMSFVLSHPGVIWDYLSVQFAGLWPLVWHFGLGGVVVLACVFLYAFTPALLARWFPNIRKILLWVGSITLAVMISVAIGVKLGENRIQAQWDVAKQNAMANGKKARADAVRDVARKPSKWLPAHKDRYDRDGQ